MPEPRHYGSVAIIIPTLRPLHIDELAWSLYEDDRLSEDGKVLMRFQTVQVIRDGRRVEFPRALGPSHNYFAGPFLIPALEAHSVGEVVEMAELLRGDKGLDRAMEAHAADFNVVEAAIQKHEMTREYMRRNPRTYRRDSRKG